MSNDEPTLPPLGARTPRNLFRWLLAWSRVHDVLAAFLAGGLTGWLLPKIVRWFLT